MKITIQMLFVLKFILKIGLKIVIKIKKFLLGIN